MVEQSRWNSNSGKDRVEKSSATVMVEQTRRNSKVEQLNGGTFKVEQ